MSSKHNKSGKKNKKDKKLNATEQDTSAVGNDTATSTGAEADTGDEISATTTTASNVDDPGFLKPPPNLSLIHI